MPEQLLRRQQDFLIIILCLLIDLLGRVIHLLAFQLAVEIDVAEGLHHVEVIEDEGTIDVAGLCGGA